MPPRATWPFLYLSGRRGCVWTDCAGSVLYMDTNATAPTRCFGTYTGALGGEATLSTAVATSLGEYVDDFDVEGLTDAYREALNTELLNPLNLTMIGDELYGPDGTTVPVDLDEAVAVVDYWALAEKYERTAP